MNARTDIKTRLSSRHVTEGPERAPHCSCLYGSLYTLRLTNAALHLPAIAHECGIKFDRLNIAEIFKKTPCVPDLKPAGRYVAKDMVEVGGRTVLMKTLLDNDADIGTLNVKLTDAVLAERKTKWKPRETNPTSGALWRYAQQVGPAVDGAVTHPGGAHEKQCYADI